MRQEILDLLKQKKCLDTHKKFEESVLTNNKIDIYDFFEMFLSNLEKQYSVCTIDARAILDITLDEKTFLELFDKFIMPYIEKYRIN